MLGSPYEWQRNLDAKIIKIREQKIREERGEIDIYED